HSLWRIDDPARLRAISEAVGSELVVLADGHHRFETANNYRRKRCAAGVDDPGADAIMTLIVELAPNQLCVRAIHRVLTGVATTVAALVAKGDADAAVLLRPVTVETIRAAAEADLRMPEKTTFFAPKPRTGMVFRSLDG